MKKTILWIAASVPCSKVKHAGGQTFRYYYNSIKSDDRFDVKLIAFSDNISKKEIGEELSGVEYHIIYSDRSIRGKIKKICNIESKYNPWNRYAGIVSNYYAFKTMRILKEYKQKGLKPDYIILEWTGIVLMVSDIHKIFPHSHLIASEHDVTYIGLQRKSKYFTGLKGLKWKQQYKHEKKLELRALDMCDLILPHNPDNCKILTGEGIDAAKVQWLVPYFNNMSSCKRKSNHKDILFFGAMERPENSLSALWFAKKVLTLLNDLDVRFVILGSNPTKELLNLESDNIHVTGFVDSVVPYFERSMCLVAPLVLGAGIKVKVLEALSAGIPVLTNDIGIEGIAAKSGREYLHCSTPEEYEYAIRKIYSCETNTDIIEKRAKSFIQGYSIEKSRDQYIARLLELEKENDYN